MHSPENGAHEKMRKLGNAVLRIGGKMVSTASLGGYFVNAYHGIGMNQGLVCILFFTAGSVAAIICGENKKS